MPDSHHRNTLLQQTNNPYSSFHATTPTLLVYLFTSATFDKTFKQNQYQPDTGCYFDGKHNIQQLKNQPDNTDRGNPRDKICSHKNQNDSKKRTKCHKEFLPCVYVNHLLSKIFIL